MSRSFCSLVNLGDEQDFRLIVGWLLMTLNPNGPFPVLVLEGEQGSAKSTTARALKQLIDPVTPLLRSLPRSERDLAIAANANWVLAFDNVSFIQDWMSDALCRLSTGEVSEHGLSTRARRKRSSNRRGR